MFDCATGWLQSLSSISITISISISSMGEDSVASAVPYANHSRYPIRVTVIFFTIFICSHVCNIHRQCITQMRRICKVSSIISEALTMKQNTFPVTNSPPFLHYLLGTHTLRSLDQKSIVMELRVMALSGCRSYASAPPGEVCRCSHLAVCTHPTQAADNAQSTIDEQ